MTNFSGWGAALHRAAVAAMATGAALWLGGCAVQHGGNGRVQIGVDDAALFGRVVQSFQLPGGGEARLRSLGGRYSVKLESQMRVIPVDNAAVAELHAVHAVGDQTVIVLTKSLPSCPYKNQLIALRGNEALSWDMGDCWHHPEVRELPGGLAWDYVQDNGSAQRFVYQNGRLTRGDLSALQLASARKTAPPPPGTGAPLREGRAPAGQGPRYLPPPPSAAVEGSAPETGKPSPSGSAAAAAAAATAAADEGNRTAPPPRAALAGPTARATPGAARPRDPAPARPLEFQAQEQKPLRIILDR